MKIVDLFAGFGGFSLAGHWMGWQTLMFCENASYPKKVLKKNFPDIFIHNDINDLTKQIIEKEFIKKYGYYDPEEIILTAGVPCQPASQAGKRKGTEDNRWLWNPTLRIVREVKPSYAVFENVPGILSLENGRPFENILNALESIGYSIESFVIPACSVGAWHRRDRVWIIAYTDIDSKSDVSINERQGQRQLGKDVSNTTEQGLQRSGQKSGQQKIQPEIGTKQFCNGPDTEKPGLEGANAKRHSQTGGWDMQCFGGDWWAAEPELGRVVDGLPDRVERIKGLGNAVIPQLVFEIFKIIDHEIKRKMSFL